MRVDFRPLPFADGVVTEVLASDRKLVVRLPPPEARRVTGGPSRADGEQAYFGMLWYDGPYARLSRHLWIENVAPGNVPGDVIVTPADNFHEYDDIVPKRWYVSLPVPGIAHRYGPGPCFRFQDNEFLEVADVELWSAPWMGFLVARNAGSIRFRRVHIRPRPASTRLMSTWRDGFHVKGNRGELLWEDCIVTGMNDDAFNISTHASHVERVVGNRQVDVRQTFPLLYIPWRTGDTVRVADERQRCLVGKARVLDVAEGPPGEPIAGEPVAPAVRLTLDQPVDGMRAGHLIWNASASNPRTTLARCTIGQSCRLQSPVTLDACRVTGLLWFYCDPAEGPFPGPVTVRRCVLRLGRGNPVYCVVASGEPEGATADGMRVPRALHDFVFLHNRIEGGFRVCGVERLRAESNAFLRHGAPVEMYGNVRATIGRNRVCK